MSSTHRRTRFDAFARPVIEPLWRYLGRRTDPETAQDALADTLLVLWRRFEDVPEDPAAAQAWAYGVARKALANQERSVRRQHRLAARVAVVDPPRDSEPEKPEHDAVSEALAALPVTHAEVLRLWAWEDLGSAEIATVLGISPNAASIRLHRAKASLREEIERRRKIGGRAGHEHSEEGRA